MVDDNSGGNNIFLWGLCRALILVLPFPFVAGADTIRALSFCLCALKTKIRKIIVTPPPHHTAK